MREQSRILFWTGKNAHMVTALLWCHYILFPETFLIHVKAAGSWCTQNICSQMSLVLMRSEHVNHCIIGKYIWKMTFFL